MTEWDDYYRRQVDEIAAAMGYVEVSPPPTRTDTIKAGWEHLRPQWPKYQINGMCVLTDPNGIIDDILYYQVQYGGIWVIEAEGVIVEKLEAK